jgi:predicted TIM-barrel fold metal-dependent hydrolase
MAMENRGVDCHAHVFCSNFAYAPDRLYEPHPSQAGSPRQFAAVLDAHGLSHGLLVQAQPYGRDNGCLLDAMRRFPGRFKGIARVSPAVTDRALAALDEAGIVGIRINLMSYGTRELEEDGAENLFARMREFGWLLQIHYEKDEIVSAAPILRKTGLRIMIDHFGRPDVRKGTGHAGFRTALEFGRDDNAIIKLSGPFRSSSDGLPYSDVDPFILAAIDAFTLERCVWGSDWPYVLMDERMDYGPGLACLARWVPDPVARRKVLWDNPSRLFGFA